MKIALADILTNMKKGRFTLQIPTISITFPGQPIVPQPVRLLYPDNWFCYLRRDRLVVGRETGFLHLTRAGFKGLQKEIKDAVGEVYWPEFKQRAEAHFKEVKKCTARYRKILQKKIDEIDAFQKS